MFNFELGKYRSIVLSIALFLLLDLGVLVLNFVISSQISGDALNVNLAGRQRMLSQRIAKTALQVERHMGEGKPYAGELDELRKSSTTFDRTLAAFTSGGRTISGAGAEITIAAIDDDKTQTILREAKEVWTPLITWIRAMGEGDSTSPEYAESLARQAEAANLQLLKLMNDLTTRVEETASSKATTLRMVQVSGISLATLNFAFILFHFIGHLRRSDRELERARKETDDILRTTQEGLFLLDGELKIGTQQSKALAGIIGVESVADRDFLAVLKPMVSEATLNTAREYLNLLLKHDVREKLVTSLNPLDCVEMAVDLGPGESETRYLTFGFNRVSEAGRVSHLLVTVNDISRRIKLEKELKATEDRARGQIGILVELMQIEPEGLHQFLRNAGEGLQNINRMLREQDGPSGARAHLVDALFRQTHRIKGDAGAIGMKNLADSFDRLENILSGLRERQNPSGEDFLPVAVQVKALFESLESIESAVTRISQVRGITIVEPPRPRGDTGVQNLPFVRQWQSFASEIAARHGNAVELTYSGIDVTQLPDGMRDAVGSMVVQFIRNSVVHGIEAADVRKGLGKPEVGRIAIYVSQRDDGGVDLSFRDDGRGISVERVRQAAIARGRLSADEAAAWSRRSIVSLIFEPGMSTHEGVDGDAGRGAGLDAVRDLVSRMGGNIRIGTMLNEYCHFRIGLRAQMVTPELVVAPERAAA